MKLCKTLTLGAAVVLASAGLTLGHVHDCIHDEPALMNEQLRLLSTGLLSTQSYGVTPGSPGSGPIFPPGNAQPIRIKFDTTGLTTAGAYCASQGDVVPTYKVAGQTITCGLDSQILTTSVRNHLVNTLLPAAAAIVSSQVSVQRLNANLVVPSTSTCGDSPIPASHTTTGVADADLVVYVTAAPLGGVTFGFSSACNRDQTQRIVVGKLNVDPVHVQWSYTDEERIQMLAHELFHILGVSAVEMFRGNNKQIEFKRGKQVAMSVLPQVTSWVRSFTGCPTLSGAEFEDENFGASLSVSSHWERLLFYEEMMTAKPGKKVSGLTLSFLNGINVGYVTNPDAGAFMYWGKGIGCGLHENSCTTVAGGMGTLFCPDTSSVANMCTYDFGAVGYCATDRFINGCQKVEAYGNRICNVEAAETDDDLKYPYVFAADSRCWGARDVHREDFQPYFDNYPRCVQTRCVSGKAEFKMPNSGVWARCEVEGAEVATPGTEYTGSMVCPDAVRMCRSLQIEVSSPTSAPATPTPATPTPATQTPATPTPATQTPATPTPAETPAQATPQPPAAQPTSAPVPPSTPVAGSHRVCGLFSAGGVGTFYDITTDASQTVMKRYNTATTPATLLDVNNYAALSQPNPAGSHWGVGVAFAATMQTRNAWMYAGSQQTSAAYWDVLGVDGDRWRFQASGLLVTLSTQDCAGFNGGSTQPPAQATPQPPAAQPTSAPVPPSTPAATPPAGGSSHHVCLHYSSNGVGTYYDIVADASQTVLKRYNMATNPPTLIDTNTYAALAKPNPQGSAFDVGVAFAANMQTRGVWMYAQVLQTTAAYWDVLGADGDRWRFLTAAGEFQLATQNCIAV